VGIANFGKKEKGIHQFPDQSRVKMPMLPPQLEPLPSVASASTLRT
jgi:hypothetical protein